jgi:hypothetical protein
MKDMRKITARVSAQTLAVYTGESASATVRTALERLARESFYKRFRALRGKVKFNDFSLDELRRDRELDEHGNVID